MLRERDPRPQLTSFSSALEKFVGKELDLDKPRILTTDLGYVEMGALYDPGIIPKSILILQEKTGRKTSISKRTLRIELSASRFRTFSYMTNANVEEELQKQIDDIEAQKEPLDYEEGYAQVVEAYDDLDARMDEATGRIDEIKKIPSEKDIKAIVRGISLLTAPYEIEKRFIGLYFSKFLNRQFE
ncbi:MAG TPA: hypothetical protein VLG67_03775 [Candidatus Saccharimonadales bacterium]|nr:hypothetical protein [Candidatus Saccharimonadales bacterium]